MASTNKTNNKFLTWSMHDLSSAQENWVWEQPKYDAENETNTENINEEKCEVDLSDEDKEVLAICGDEKEEPSTLPSITTTKPPLPGINKKDNYKEQYKYWEREMLVQNIHLVSV